MSYAEPGGDDDTTEAPEIGSAAVTGMRQDLSWRREAKRAQPAQPLQSQCDDFWVIGLFQWN
jgi:hypothetical protein